MQRVATRFLNTIAIALAVAVLVPAAAVAGRSGTPSRASEQPTAAHMPLRTCHQYCPSPAQRTRQHHVFTDVRPRIVTVVTNGGFSWNDAAIGFGTACGLALVTFGVFARRRHGAVNEIREPA